MIPLETLPLSGTLREVPLVHIFHLLKKGRRSGLLTLQLWKIEKAVHFHEGEIIFARSNYSNDRLGEVFLKAGKINFKQYDIAAEIYETTKKKKGMILLEQGFIQPKDLFDMLLLQVKEIVSSLFNWEDGQYLFSETTAPSDQAIGIKIDPYEIVREAIYHITDWTQLIQMLPPLDSILQKNSAGVSAGAGMRLEEEREVLSLVDNERSIRDILMLASKRTLAWVQTLNLLMTTGRVTFRLLPQNLSKEKSDPIKKDVGSTWEDSKTPPPSPEAKRRKEGEVRSSEEQIKKIEAICQHLAEQNYYEILGISSKASLDEIKSAYLNLAKTYHPDRYTDKAFSGIIKQVERIFIEVRNAYDTLSVENKRREYDTQLYQQSSEYQSAQATRHIKHLLDRAESAFCAHDLKMALYFFEEALRLIPEGDQKANVYLRYGQVLAQVPGQLHPATDALQKSAALNPNDVKPHLELGVIFSRAGLKSKAIKAFQEALKRDPHNKVAQGEIARLTNKDKS